MDNSTVIFFNATPAEPISACWWRKWLYPKGNCKMVESSLSVLQFPIYFMPHFSARIHSFKSTCSVCCHTTIQHHYVSYYWYCSLDMHDCANGPILVPWTLGKCQALYEDVKGFIILATMVWTTLRWSQDPYCAAMGEMMVTTGLGRPRLCGCCKDLRWYHACKVFHARLSWWWQRYYRALSPS